MTPIDSVTYSVISDGEVVLNVIDDVCFRKLLYANGEQGIKGAETLIFNIQDVVSEEWSARYRELMVSAFGAYLPNDTEVYLAGNPLILDCSLVTIQQGFFLLNAFRYLQEFPSATVSVVKLVDEYDFSVHEAMYLASLFTMDTWMSSVVDNENHTCFSQFVGEGTVKFLNGSIEHLLGSPMTETTNYHSTGKYVEQILTGDRKATIRGMYYIRGMPHAKQLNLPAIIYNVEQARDVIAKVRSVA